MTIAIRSFLRPLVPPTLVEWIRTMPVWHNSILPRLQGRWYPDPPYGVDRNYEPSATKVMEKIVRLGWICADVGGHIGRHTALLADLVGPGGRVIVFEPYPCNAGVIHRHMSALGYAGRVTIEPYAVDDGSQAARWLFAGRRGDTSEINTRGETMDGRRARRLLRVPAISLDRYFDGRPLQFVKIDIEGGERQTIRGMWRILRRQRPFLLVEFHTAEAWAARRELVEADYTLCDLVGRDVHSLAVPREHVSALSLISPIGLAQS